MAGDWIKIEHWTTDKPEVFQMADTLGIDPDEVVGKLVRLWVWADQQTTDGNARSVTQSLLDRIAGRVGFATAMESVGWLTRTGSVFSFVNFDRHNGETAKERALNAKRAQKFRSRKRNAGVTEPALPREEKRREEKNMSTCSSGEEKPKLRFDPVDRELAEHIWTCVYKLQPTRKPPDLDRWANDVRLMREADSRPPPLIREVFDWANRDSFWQTNILSPSKLRDKFDDLHLKINREPNGTSRKPTAGQLFDKDAGAADPSVGTF